MQCPKCKHDMEVPQYQGVKIHRCTNCRGLWFRPASVDKLKDLWRSEFLDKGDVKVGKEYNKLDDIKCPECDEKLDVVVDEKQIHIQYESCPNDHGVFFDAGEFTDWKYDTAMDRVRGILARIKS